MTRINIIPVEELMDQHLVAEYRELPMVGSALQRSIKSKSWNPTKLPEKFTLNKGHVKFFYNKGLYLYNRYQELIIEMRRRGMNPDPDRVFKRDQWPDELYNDWTPTTEDQAITRERIALSGRISERPDWYSAVTLASCGGGGGGGSDSTTSSDPLTALYGNVNMTLDPDLDTTISFEVDGNYDASDRTIENGSILLEDIFSFSVLDSGVTTQTSIVANVCSFLDTESLYLCAIADNSGLIVTTFGGVRNGTAVGEFAFCDLTLTGGQCAERLLTSPTGNTTVRVTNGIAARMAINPTSGESIMPYVAYQQQGVVPTDVDVVPQAMIDAINAVKQ